jgi:hypothetical protein
LHPATVFPVLAPPAAGRYVHPIVSEASNIA